MQLFCCSFYGGISHVISLSIFSYILFTYLYTALSIFHLFLILTPCYFLSQIFHCFHSQIFHHPTPFHPSLQMNLSLFHSISTLLSIFLRQGFCRSRCDEVLIYLLVIKHNQSYMVLKQYHKSRNHFSIEYCYTNESCQVSEFIYFFNSLPQMKRVHRVCIS